MRAVLPLGISRVDARLEYFHDIVFSVADHDSVVHSAAGSLCLRRLLGLCSFGRWKLIIWGCSLFTNAHGDLRSGVGYCDWWCLFSASFESWEGLWQDESWRLLGRVLPNTQMMSSKGDLRGS